MKFNIGVFFENLSRKFKFQYNLTRITGTLHGKTWQCTYVLTICKKGARWWLWTETCSTPFYGIKVLCLTVYFVFRHWTRFASEFLQFSPTAWPLYHCAILMHHRATGLTRQHIIIKSGGDLSDRYVWDHTVHCDHLNCITLAQGNLIVASEAVVP